MAKNQHIMKRKKTGRVDRLTTFGMPEDELFAFRNKCKELEITRSKVIKDMIAIFMKHCTIMDEKKKGL